MPRTRTFASWSDVEREADGLAYPCVVKPRFSRHWDGTGPITRGTVTYAKSAQSLRDILRSARQPPEWFLVQELVAGDGLGVFALMNQGEPRAVFAHRRIREANPTGGRASLAESIPPDERIMAPALRLLGALGWTGVAMVEFKDPGGTAPPIAMEINGRFWGSLPLAIAAGVDFPLLLVRQVLGLDTAAPPSVRVWRPLPASARRPQLPRGGVEGASAPLVGSVPRPRRGARRDPPFPGRWHSYNFRASDPLPALREAGDFLRQEARSLARRRGAAAAKGAAQHP